MLSQVAPSDDLAFFRPHQFLARENERPEAFYDILEGWDENLLQHALLFLLSFFLEYNNF